jgi:hypothetical protein
MKMKYTAIIILIITMFTTPAYAQGSAKPTSEKKKTSAAKKKSPPNKKKTSQVKKPVAPTALVAPVFVQPGEIIETITPIEGSNVSPPEGIASPSKSSSPQLNKDIPPPKKITSINQKKISNQDIKNANNAIGIQYIKTNVNYTETNADGTKFNTENRYVPGFAINFSLMKDFLFGNDYIAASYSKNSGNTNYVGGPADGSRPYGSIKQADGAVLKDYFIRYGRGFELSAQTMLTPFLEYGSHQWDRDLGAYQETYTNKYYAGGLLGQISPAKNWVLTASGMYGRTTNSDISISGPIAQLFPGASLGNSSIYRLGFGVDYAFTKEFHGNFNWAYSSFKYGRSVSMNNLYEPDSTTKYTTYGVGVSYNF